MAPRRNDPAPSGSGAVRKPQGPGQDRKRTLEDARHHPVKATRARATHKPQKKPKLPAPHATHTRPAPEEMGPHRNKPSPIKPAKTMTRTGARKR